MPKIRIKVEAEQTDPGLWAVVVTVREKIPKDSPLEPVTVLPQPSRDEAYGRIETISRNLVHALADITLSSGGRARLSIETEGMK